MKTNLVALGVLLLSTLLLPGSVWAKCQITSVELPVTVSGLCPLVTAEINDADVTFVVDSGAFYSMITPAAAERLKLPHRRAPEGLRVEGIASSVSASTVRCG
jgi:predicted aspartyl protease